MSKKVLLSVLFFIAAVMSETEVTRGQFWGRVTYAPKLEKGIGFITSAGIRENFSIAKEVNGSTKPATEQEFWLKELMIGPTFNKKLNDKLSMNNQLLYRPQLWFPDNNSGTTYLRHTVMLNSNLFQKVGSKLKLHYRLSLWQQFEATQRNETLKEMDNELYIRLMAGPVVPIGKRLTIFSKIEPFLKVTASDTDIDGTELLNKVVSWNGITFKATRDFSLSAQYVLMVTHPSDVLTVKDNYLYVHMTYAPQKVKKKK